MKLRFIYILGVISLLSFSACAPRVQFTQTIKEQNSLKEDELKRIQFYTTGDIILQRLEDSGSNKQTKEGELVITSGNSLEQVVIKAGTPGIVEKILDEYQLIIRFEAGEGKLLTFGNSPDNKGAYYLIATETQDNKKVIDYAGKKFALAQNSAYVSLTFKMRTLSKFKKEQRVVKGMKL